jgi:LCP family protein required for cell wall assembly
VPLKNKQTKRINEIKDVRRLRFQEDESDFSKPISSDTYTSTHHKRHKRKRRVTIVAIIAAALICGIVAAFYTFIGSLNSQFNEGISDISVLNTVLKDTEEGKPFYVLLMGTDERKANQVERSDAILLARIDTGNKKTVLVSIPRDTQINIEGHGKQKINAAHALNGGAVGSVKAVNELAGVEISHYVEIDFRGFQGLVDSLGGVEVDVPFEINDPDASIDGLGAGHVEKGLQVLDGDKALIFCRSRATAIGDYQRQANQRMFLQALASKVLHSDPVTLINSISAVSDAISTDMNVDSI